MSAVSNIERAEDNLSRGQLLRMSHDLEGAIVAYNAAIELDPRNTRAYLNRGLIYTLLEDHRQALADYTKAIELDPDNAVAYFNRGLEKQIDGDIEGAKSDYTAALSLQPKPRHLLANINCNLGILYETLGDHKMGLANFNAALTDDPDNVAALYNRGLAHERNGDFVFAVIDYIRVLQLNPDHAQSRYMQSLINTVANLQAELKLRLASHTSDVNKAMIDIWPLVAKALQGVQFEVTMRDPFAMLDRSTIDLLINQVLDVNSSADAASTKGQRTGNGN